MMKLIILSLVMTCGMASPVILTPSGIAIQAAGGVQAQPALITADQLSQLIQQQQSFLTQATTTPEENPLGASSLVRDPSNPTTDVVIHSGFPFVSSSLLPQPSASGISGLSNQLQTTRVGISTLGNLGGQTAHVATVQQPAQPQFAQLRQLPVIQQQQPNLLSGISQLTAGQTVQSSGAAAGLNLPAGTTFLIPASAANSQTHQQLTAAGFRTIPITVQGQL